MALWIVYMHSGSLSCGGEKHFKPEFGEKLLNLLSVFQTWHVTLFAYMQCLWPEDHWKGSYGSLPIHFDQDPVLLALNNCLEAFFFSVSGLNE